MSIDFDFNEIVSNVRNHLGDVETLMGQIDEKKSDLESIHDELDSAHNDLDSNLYTLQEMNRNIQTLEDAQTRAEEHDFYI